MSAHIEDLAGSGLEFEALRKKGLVRVVSAADLKKILKIDDAESGLEYIYTPTYSRYKIYRKPLTGFAAKAKDSRPKYVQPENSTNHLYVPPLTDWDTVLEDAAQTIAITEGEKKTIALNLRGVPCVGLGGVNSLGNRKKGQMALPELKEYVTGGRNVLIIFDIDEGYTTMKPEVARAALILANLILELGGNPKIVTLPSDGTKKCAVDDWLQTHDLSSMSLYLEIVRFAKPLDTAIALYAEAEKYVYIQDSNALGRIDTREAVMVSDYRISSGNQQVIVQELTLKRVKGGGVVPAIDLAVRTLSDAFLKWPSRPAARATTYEPGTLHYLTKKGEFNQWKGWAQKVPTDITESDVAPLWNAFQAIYREDALTMWNWFMYPIAKPGAKMVIIPVIQGMVEGIGKSSIPEFFTKFIYGEGVGTPSNATTLNAMSLRDGRLEFMIRKQFLFLDDANDIHGNDVEALLKNLATTSSVRANPKYLRSYECLNLINLCITTNRTMPFKVPETDRRLFFPHVSGAVLPKVWDDLHKWGRAGGGGKVVAYAQQLFDVDAIDPYMRAPMTEKKAAIIDMARSPFENFIHELSTAAKLGELRRVVFTGRELKLLAEMENEVRSSHDVGPMILNRAVTAAGGQHYGGRVKISGILETIYVLAETDKWNRATTQPAQVAKEIAAHPLDKVRIPFPGRKVVGIDNPPAKKRAAKF